MAPDGLFVTTSFLIQMTGMSISVFSSCSCVPGLLRYFSSCALGNAGLWAGLSLLKLARKSYPTQQKAAATLNWLPVLSIACRPMRKGPACIDGSRPPYAAVGGTTTLEHCNPTARQQTHRLPE